MWSRIYDCVIKSLISVESVMSTGSQKKTQQATSGSRLNCFELYGYDIMLDSDLNPWLLEVNLAPSLSADSPLDYNIKSNLIVDLFNLVGVRRPLKKKQNMKPAKQKFNSINTNHNQVSGNLGY